MRVNAKKWFGALVVGLAVWGTAAPPAAGDGASGITNPDGEKQAVAAGRRHATLSYYAFHIAKLDATVSFCSGARTSYRDAFEQVVAAGPGGGHSDTMEYYDSRYDTLTLGPGDYACPEDEVAYYRNRIVRQIKNLKRDLKDLEGP